MVKCILKGLQQTDAYSGDMTSFETEYNGIPEACAMWASGYKHCFLENCELFYSDNGKEVPERITDAYYDRYYYGRYIFDENGEEICRKSWNFLHIKLFSSFTDIEVCPKKSGILLKK